MDFCDFLAFGLNTERYGVNMENTDQSKSEYGHFSRNENHCFLDEQTPI